jgi:hypothetical protein
MSKLTVLLPAAGPADRVSRLRPNWMLSGPKNELLLALAFGSIPRARVGRVVVGLLRAHEERWHASAGVRKAFGEAAEIVTFEASCGEAEAAAQMVRRAAVTGPVLVKAPDSWFATAPEAEGDFVAVADLREHPDIAAVAMRAFVAAGANGAVERVVERSVVSNLVAAGAWGFADAQAFARACEAGPPASATAGAGLGAVVARMMEGGAAFRAVKVGGYRDAASAREWHAWRRRFRTLVVDVDGVVVKNRGAWFPPYWTDPDEPIMPNVEHLKALAAQGAQLVFMTARPEAVRAKTEATLRGLGLSWHALVMGCHHAQRVIVNDHAPSNPYPSCEAVNLPRESATLPDLLPLEP